MKAKKILAMALAAAMMFSCTACGSSDSSSSTASETTTTESAESTESTETTETATSGDVVTPNQDPANTEKTDETLTIGLSSEPSTLYGAAGGTTENE